MARFTRRRLLAAAGGLVAASFAHAQSPRNIPVIGLLDAGERLEQTG
jgi:hypothetical protein